ncbi:hypothetical protein [Gemmatimonas sp.]|uniref:hypothetical protein n=1 Tax=Gemmatimonas sp. TaxID=1962908 RepID=UPI003F6E821B
MIESRATQVLEIVDMLFSFQELGFEAFESQRYITTLLAKEGFTIEKGIAGIPSFWTANVRLFSGSTIERFLRSHVRRWLHVAQSHGRELAR